MIVPGADAGKQMRDLPSVCSRSRVRSSNMPKVLPVIVLIGKTIWNSCEAFAFRELSGVPFFAERDKRRRPRRRLWYDFFLLKLYQSNKNTFVALTPPRARDRCRMPLVASMIVPAGLSERLFPQLRSSNPDAILSRLTGLRLSILQVFALICAAGSVLILTSGLCR